MAHTSARRSLLVAAPVLVAGGCSAGSTTSTGGAAAPACPDATTLTITAADGQRRDVTMVSAASLVEAQGGGESASLLFADYPATTKELTSPFRQPRPAGSTRVVVNLATPAVAAGTYPPRADPSGTVVGSAPVVRDLTVLRDDTAQKPVAPLQVELTEVTPQRVCGRMGPVGAVASGSVIVEGAFATAREASTER